MKTVYLFDGITGEYTGTYDAQESPLEQGVYIEPSDSTETAPPTAGVNQVAVFSNKAWVLDDDYRGQTIYDQTTGAPQEVTAIGPIPSGFALTPPPPTLAQAQATQIASLAASYSAAITADIAYTAVGGTAQTYQADAGSVSNLNYMLQAYTPAGATPTGFYWVAADNTPVPFTLADLQDLAKAMGDRGWAAFQNLQTKKADVMAAITIKAVQAITF